MIYLGKPGRLVGIECPAEQQESVSEQWSTQVTMLGKVKAQRLGQTRRVWDLRLPRTTTPQQVAVLREFTQGQWGLGPFWFVSAEAPVTNLYPRDGLEYVAHTGGPLRLEDGTWAPSSVVRSDGTQGVVLFGGQETAVPVFAGQSVTGSAWLTGAGAHVVLIWYDVSGVQVGSTVVPTTAQYVPANASGAVRVSVTGVAPDGAVTVELAARQATAATRPCLTWTGEVFEYGNPAGCPQAVVRETGVDVLAAWRTPGKAGRRSNVSFTVQEVG